MNIKKTSMYIALLLSLTICGGAMAAPTWICSITEAVACDADGTIGPPDLEGLEHPTFLRVDAKKKEVTLLAPASRKGEVTKIDTVHKGKGAWILSGVEEERAWSMVISTKGHMTLSVTGDGGTWSIFGNALPESK